MNDDQVRRRVRQMADLVDLPVITRRDLIRLLTKAMDEGVSRTNQWWLDVALSCTSCGHTSPIRDVSVKDIKAPDGKS